MARRRARIGLSLLVAVWAIVLIADAVLIRTHLLKSTYTGIATLSGFVLGGLAACVWYGEAGTPHLSSRDGQELISARTLTGVRTIHLDSLVSVRRFQMMGRFGGEIDTLRLRDRYGVRLAIDPNREADTAIRRAIDSADAGTVRVSRAASDRLASQRRSALSRSPRLFLGLLMGMAALGAAALGSYLIACILAGVGAGGQ